MLSAATPRTLQVRPGLQGLTFAHAILVGAGLRDPINKENSKIALIAAGKVTVASVRASE